MMRAYAVQALQPEDPCRRNGDEKSWQYSGLVEGQGSYDTGLMLCSSSGFSYPKDTACEYRSDVTHQAAETSRRGMKLEQRYAVRLLARDVVLDAYD